MARLAESVIERIKQDIALVRLVESQGHQLNKHGKDFALNRPFHEDRTASPIIKLGGVVTDYAYSPAGIRHSQSDGVIDKSYLVDANRSYAQVLAESVNGSRDRQSVWQLSHLLEGGEGPVMYRPVLRNGAAMVVFLAY